MISDVRYQFKVTDNICTFSSRMPTYSTRPHFDVHCSTVIRRMNAYRTVSRYDLNSHENLVYFPGRIYGSIEDLMDLLLDLLEGPMGACGISWELGGSQDSFVLDLEGSHGSFVVDLGRSHGSL